MNVGLVVAVSLYFNISPLGIKLPVVADVGTSPDN